MIWHWRLQCTLQYIKFVRFTTGLFREKIKRGDAGFSAFSSSQSSRAESEAESSVLIVLLCLEHQAAATRLFCSRVEFWTCASITTHNRVIGLVVKFSVAIRNVGEPWVRFPDYATTFLFGLIFACLEIFHLFLTYISMTVICDVCVVGRVVSLACRLQQTQSECYCFFFL
jgi:hypothetical protein